MTQTEEFSALGLTDRTLEAIRSKGFETPSPIQRLTIPALLDTEKTNDIIAQAQTGTGKTAAFGLPILERLRPLKGATQALILVPTRELALQVTEELLSLNGRSKLSISAIYGGASMSEQLRRLSKGVDVVVGTPGRILDHLHRGTLDIRELQYLILDEADEMLNMGFIEEILSHANDRRRILLFSATMPERIISLSKKYMRDSELLRVPSQEMTTELTDQIYFEVRDSDKFDALTRIIDTEPEFYGIVFSRTKVGVDELVNRLTERGYAAEGLHGDVSQGQREKILRKFKKKLANILVATDVAARGIDINNLTHVINYSLPQDTESYVHRIGRTGRAGNTGTAVTFISPAEFRQFGYLRRDIKAQIKKESLPSAQDVIEIKKTRIKDDLAEIIENGSYEKYREMAAEMLSGLAPEVALASLLQLAFNNELDESRYPEIRSINVDRRGTARLFLAVGRADGYPQAGRASAARVRAARRQDRRSAGAGELFVRIGSVFGGPRGDPQAERHSPGRTADRPVGQGKRAAERFSARSACRKQRRGPEYGWPPRSPSCRENGTDSLAWQERAVRRVDRMGCDQLGHGRRRQKRKRLGRQERVRPASDLEEANEALIAGPCARRVTNWHGN